MTKYDFIHKVKIAIISLPNKIWFIVELTLRSELRLEFDLQTKNNMFLMCLVMKWSFGILNPPSG